VTDGPKADVIKEMLDRKMRVTVNSDDPAYFGGYMTENFSMVQAAVGLQEGDLCQLSRNAFETAWLPREAKDHYLGLLDSYAASGSAPNARGLDPTALPTR
jgi:adenosine deaminase